MSSVVNHLPGTFYLELRQDYVLFCSSLPYRKSKSRSSPYCKALILAIMERWTNDRMKKKTSLYVNMTLVQWEESMYGMFGHCVIADSLEELVHEGILTRIAYKPSRGGKDQYKYLYNYQVVNEWVATSKNSSCDDEQFLKIEDQLLKVEDVTAKNSSCSPVATSKNRSFIEGTENQDIYSKKESMPPVLPPDQQKWFEEIYCGSKVAPVPPVVTETLKKHVSVLSRHIKTVEELNSLYDYCRPKIRGKNPTVYAGNLVHCLNGWLQERQESASPEEAPEAEPELKDDDQILWTMNPDYPGRAVEDWRNFRMMTVKEAREKYKYGQVTLNWQYVDEHEIRARLINEGILPRKKRIVVIT